MSKQDIDQIKQRLSKLEQAVFASKANKAALPKKIQFSLNQRAYAKRYLTKASGPIKFTLLCGYLTKGNVEASIELGNITELWNQMNSILGKYNAAYSLRAKENGWVDSPSQGKYQLTSEWQESLS